MHTAPQDLQCSFCAKKKAEVAKIIAGPGVFICDTCVALCVDILEADRNDPASNPELPGWEDMTDEEILARIPRISAAGAQVEDNLREWVSRLRGRGVTWGRIGEALGITRQSAWGRFSGEE